MAYSANKMLFPIIEKKLNLRNITCWKKQMFGWLVGLKVVIPEALGGSGK